MGPELCGPEGAPGGRIAGVSRADEFPGAGWGEPRDGSPAREGKTRSLCPRSRARGRDGGDFSSGRVAKRGMANPRRAIVRPQELNAIRGARNGCRRPGARNFFAPMRCRAREPRSAGWRSRFRRWDSRPDLRDSLAVDLATRSRAPDRGARSTARRISSCLGAPACGIASSSGEKASRCFRAAMPGTGSVSGSRRKTFRPAGGAGADAGFRRLGAVSPRSVAAMPTPVDGAGFAGCAMQTRPRARDREAGNRGTLARERARSPPERISPSRAAMRSRRFAIDRLGEGTLPKVGEAGRRICRRSPR
jgi:hypothetical protein